MHISKIVHSPEKTVNTVAKQSNETHFLGFIR